MRKKTRDTPSASNNRLKGILTTVAVTLTVVLLLGSMSVLADTGRGGSGGNAILPEPEQTTFGGKTLRVWTFDTAPTETPVDYVVDNMMQHCDCNHSSSVEPCFKTDNGALKFSPMLFGNDITSYLTFGEGLEMNFDEFSYFTIDFDVNVDVGNAEEFTWFSFGLTDGSDGEYYMNRDINGAKINLSNGTYHVTYLINTNGDVIVYIDGEIFASFNGALSESDKLLGLFVTPGYDQDRHSYQDTNLQEYQVFATIDNVIFNYFEPGYTGAISKLMKNTNMKTNPDTVLGGCMEN